MKKQILKSVLCLSLSAAMIFGEAGAALAETGTPVETVEEISTETTDETETEESTETEATTETETEAATETEATADAVEETTETDKASSEDVDASEDIAASEDIDAVGEKIVAKYNLANVGGLAYDRASRRLSWNKVPGATQYDIEYSTAGESSTHTCHAYNNIYYIFDEDDDYFEADKTYTFKVTAKNTDELYEVASNLTYDNYEKYEYGIDYDRYTWQYNATTGTTYTLYKYPTSASATSTSTVAKVSTSKSVSSLSKIALKEVTDSDAVFTLSPATVQTGEYIKYEYANNAAYNDNGAELNSDSGSIYSSTGTITRDIEIPLSKFTAGDTIYIRARVYNPNYELAAGQTDKNRYSNYVTATYKIPASVMNDVALTVTGSSIRLKPSSTGTVTGYQYQKKSGKKWITLAQQSNDYTDKSLKSDTKYTYRVRGYIYNKNTKKTSYTDYKTVSAYTWGSALNLKGSAKSSTSVKLSWSKVSKASGYEIYRIDTSSSSYNRTKGEGTESFDNATLIKTIKKAKTTSYTDKKLTKGNSYDYIVRAYRTVNKNKFYIEDTVTVSLAAKDGIRINNAYYTSAGKYTVAWQKMTGISGYKVEKQDPKTGKWVSYKTLKSSKTSYTFPKVNAGADSVSYRIRPYKGNKIFDDEYVTVYPKLAAVKNVKAVKTSEGVKISWSKVSGADYYQVYRATKEPGSYDKTTKLYTCPSATLVYEVNYKDTSAGVNLAPVKKDDKYTVNGKTYISYTYDTKLKNAVNYNGKFYEEISQYHNAEITGTSVVDKTVTVKSLISKDSDPSYNKNTDPEYVSDWNWYTGNFGEYQKNADGSLKTKDVTVHEGPQAGCEYYYYVVAVAKPANGANGNATTTYSAGCTKPAHVTYTKVAAAKASKVSSATSSKKATATIKIKKVSGAKGYAIYRSTKKSSGYVQVGTTTGTSYTDSDVVGGKTYYYKVASYKKTENGTFIYSKLSSPKKVKIKK